MPAGEPVVTRKQVRIFAFAVALLWIFSDWPMHDLAERYLYCVHMAQHMVFSLVVPPLLIIGTPEWLQRWLLQPKAIDFVGQADLPALPGRHHLQLRHRHRPRAVLCRTSRSSTTPSTSSPTCCSSSPSMIMWFPVLNRMPEYPALRQPATMVYLFVQSIIPNVPVAFLAFADGVVYSFYAHVPRPFRLTAVEDQQIAGRRHEGRRHPHHLVDHLRAVHPLVRARAR